MKLASQFLHWKGETDPVPGDIVYWVNIFQNRVALAQITATDDPEKVSTICCCSEVQFEGGTLLVPAENAESMVFVGTMEGDLIPRTAASDALVQMLVKFRRLLDEKSQDFATLRKMHMDSLVALKRS